MPKRHQFTLRARLISFVHAAAGLLFMLRTQPSAWIHAAATVAVIVAALSLDVTRSDWCWLIAAIGLVWSAEGINTALEQLADAVHPDEHPLVGQAKDAAAGAVLAAAVTAAVIGIIVFWPYVLG